MFTCGKCPDYDWIDRACPHKRRKREPDAEPCLLVQRIMRIVHTVLQANGCSCERPK